MELHDIFPAVDIVEYSFYVLLGAIVFSFVLLYVLYVFVIKKIRGKSYYLNILKKHPKDDAKYTANLFSYYGQHIVSSEEEKILLSHINKRLNAFKYTQGHQTVPKAVQDDIDLLIDKTIGRKNV